jgi:alpha-1,3-rhamnosyl/mannosyltransferase
LKYPQYIEPRNLRFLSKHVRRWIRQSTKVVAVSHATEKEIRQELPCATGKLEVVVNAVNTQLYRPQEQTAVDSIRKKYNLTDYLLFVSNIEPRKNIETLIEAYKASIGKKGTQLFIVGGAGWLNEPIMEAIKRSQDEGFAVMKNTYFVPDEDLPALMQGARSIVIPSWHEGFGLPLLQAISSGGRVIASDIPALREAAGLVNSDRITFFDPKSVGELMAELNATKKSKLSNKAGKIVKVRQWSDAVRELTVIIDSMKVRKR